MRSLERELPFLKLALQRMHTAYDSSFDRTMNVQFLQFARSVAYRVTLEGVVYVRLTHSIRTKGQQLPSLKRQYESLFYSAKRKRTLPNLVEKGA